MPACATDLDLCKILSSFKIAFLNVALQYVNERLRIFEESSKQRILFSDMYFCFLLKFDYSCRVL